MAATHSSRNGTVRVVLYLRMSSAKQDKSIPAQRDELTRQIEKRPDHRIVGEYLDEAISGDDTDRRPEFLRMRNDAQAGTFDKIACWDQDRFGRFDLIDGGHYIRPFRQAGIVLETIAQGLVDWEDLTGQLIYSVNQVGKAQFLRDLSRNTTRGLLASAREGRAGTGGPNPFGYHSAAGVVTIVPAEAEIVRLVFRLYLKHDASIRSVAGELNRRNIKPPRGLVWRTSGVRAILGRRKYTGTFVYGERNAGKYFAMRDGEVVPRLKSEKITEAEPITHPDHFEAIIDKKTFDRTQVKLFNRKGDTARKQTRQYLLATLVKCGDCGGAMGGLSRPSGAIYHCRLYHQSGRSACHCNTIHEEPLVSVISQKIQERYLSEPALARLRRKIKAKLVERDRPPSRRDLDRLRSAITKLDRKIDVAEDTVIEAPPGIRPGLYRKIESLAADRDKLRAELDALTNRGTLSSGGDGSNKLDQMIEALGSLGVALREASPADTKRLLAAIVSKIELHFTDGTGRQKRDFTHGTIFVRPDVGENRAAEPGLVAHMNTIPPNYRTRSRGIRLFCLGRLPSPARDEA